MTDIEPAAMLVKCLPQADLGIIINPMVCNSCIEYLKDYLNFARNCRYTEIKIQNLLKLKATNNGSQEYNNRLKSDVGFQENEEVNQFETESALQTQQAAETELILEKNEAAGSDQQTSTANKEKLFHCECGFKTDYLECIKQHKMKGKTDEEAYNCHLCTFQLKSRKCLRQHLTSHKNKETGLYKCPQCKFSTLDKRKLKYHVKYHTIVQRTKSKEKTYKCDLCKFRPKSRSCLNLHLTSYKDKETGLYQCPQCEFSTAGRRKIEHHVKQHTKSEKEKMFTCNLCLENFETQHGLGIHINSHEEKFYKCSVCENGFRTKFGLGIHMRRHVEKHYNCSICQYETKNQHDMKLHIDIKHRENPWKTYRF